MAFTTDGAKIFNVQIMGERQTIIGVDSAASTKVPDCVAKKISAQIYGGGI